jgi:hypothetical protein
MSGVMGTGFDLLGPAVREAFAVLVASAQGDPRAADRAGWALRRALPAFDDLLDGPPVPSNPGSLDEAYDQLRVCVLFDALGRRWGLGHAELEHLWEHGVLRHRLEDAVGLAGLSA